MTAHRRYRHDAPGDGRTVQDVPPPIETVIQHAPDGQARIVRRRFPLLRYQCWVVERLQADGAWIRSKSGPWDYLCNARAELHGRDDRDQLALLCERK